MIYEVLHKTVPSENIYRSGIKDGGHYENSYIASYIQYFIMRALDLSVHKNDDLMT